MQNHEQIAAEKPLSVGAKVPSEGLGFQPVSQELRKAEMPEANHSKLG